MKLFLGSFAILLLLIAVGYGPGRCAAGDLPTVYCYALGVSDNSNAPLADAKSAATNFAAYVKQLFPTSSKVVVLTAPEDPPTPARIKGILDVEIRNIPRYSSVIFYFAGHGIQHSTPEYDDDLHLVLSGSDTTGYETNSLDFGDLAVALDRKKMITGMVLLDCCHSGTPLDVRTRSGKLLQECGKDGSPRYVWLFATSAKQETYSGDFTDEFLKEWRTNVQTCLKPDLIIDDINRIAPATDAGYRKREVFPPKVDWCVGTLGQPASIVTIIPKGDFRDSFHVDFSDGVTDDPDFTTADRPFYLRFASKRSGLNVIVSFGTNHPAISLTTNDLKPDVVLLQTDGRTLSLVQPDDRSLSLTTSELNKFSTAVFSLAGYDGYTADFVEIVGRTLARQGAVTDARHLYEIAAQENPSSTEWTALLDTNETSIIRYMAGLASTEEKQRYLSDVELVNGIGSASEGWYSLAAGGGTRQDAEFARLRTYIGSKVVGNYYEAERMKRSLIKTIGSKGQSEKLDEIYVIDTVGSPVIQQSATKFAETTKEWAGSKGVLTGSYYMTQEHEDNLRPEDPKFYR
jgi:hypothetical protein